MLTLGYDQLAAVEMQPRRSGPGPCLVTILVLGGWVMIGGV